jgi:hypothetical protein
MGSKSFRRGSQLICWEAVFWTNLRMSCMWVKWLLTLLSGSVLSLDCMAIMIVIILINPSLSLLSSGKFWEQKNFLYFLSFCFQGPEHPNPGKSFSARGFPRHCYLPDSEKGRKVRANVSVGLESLVLGQGLMFCSLQGAGQRELGLFLTLDKHGDKVISESTTGKDECD